MPKIIRTTQKIFGDTAPSQQITAFGTAMTNNPNYTTDIATIQNAAFESGWASAIQSDKAPYEEDTNGLFYAITKQLAYLFQQGPFEWDAGTTYYTNSTVTVVENGLLTIKRSTSDNNIGNNPLTDNVNWVDYFSQRVIHTIADPIVTLNPVLADNEIWLEGAEVSRTTYATLFQIYGTTYGAGDGETTFNLPDCRGRVFWGAEDFGYLQPGLPNLYGWFQVGAEFCSADGVLFTRWNAGSRNTQSSASGSRFDLNASRYNSIYGRSSTVQPPSIKVRVKTRYQ